MDSSAVGIAQLAHAARVSPFCAVRGGDALFPDDFGKMNLYNLRICGEKKPR